VGFIPRHPLLTYQYYTFSLFGIIAITLNYPASDMFINFKHPPPPAKKLHDSFQIPEDHKRPQAFKIAIL
jgi:hypothetical protein